MTGEWLSVASFAKKHRMTSPTVNRLIQSGVLQVIPRVGKDLRPNGTYWVVDPTPGIIRKYIGMEQNAKDLCMITVKEACQILGVSHFALRKWKREGLLPFHSMNYKGRQYLLFSVNGLMKCMDKKYPKWTQTFIRPSVVKYVEAQLRERIASDKELEAFTQLKRKGKYSETPTAAMKRLADSVPEPFTVSAKPELHEPERLSEPRPKP